MNAALLGIYGMGSALGVDLDQIIDDVLHKDERVQESIDWYKQLDMNQKINLKEITDILCGMPYQFMVKILGFKEAIHQIHMKLRAEGFEV